MSEFSTHTPDSAPEAARPIMAAISGQFGFLPAAVGRMATSPELLRGFTTMNRLFESTTLDPLARETMIMTIATRNGCHICVAMHTAALHRLHAPDETIRALREQRSIDQPKLEAVRLFTTALLDRSGAVTSEELKAFFEAGYSRRHALELVLGLGTYTLSTLANRLTDAPLDEAFAPFCWHEDQRQASVA